MDRKFLTGLRLWTGLYIGWILLLFWLSMASIPPAGLIDPAYEDKIHHVLAYAVLAFLGERSWRQLPKVRRAWLWSLLTALLLGAVMEAAQAILTPARIGSWDDWIADGVGAVLALGLIGLKNKKRRQGS